MRRRDRSDGADVASYVGAEAAHVRVRIAWRDFEPTDKESAVSSPSRRRPPAEVREGATCMCVHGGACSSFAAGHALHLIQARLAAATPSEWIDAIVEDVDEAAGEVSLRPVSDGATIKVWHAASTGLAVGDPAALHGRYAVLSAWGRRLNVARLDLTPPPSSTP